MKTSSSIVTFLLLVACGASRANAGDNNTHAVVDKLAATWAPLAKQTGDARTAAVCAEADKLAGLAKAVPMSPPSGSVVDAETWSDDRDAVDAQRPSAHLASHRTELCRPTSGRRMPGEGTIISAVPQWCSSPTSQP
jgi:hypothetical protein